MILFLTALLLATQPQESAEEVNTSSHKITEKALYIGAGATLGSLSFLAQLGWGASLISPWALNIGNECLLLSHLSGSAAKRSFVQLFKDSPSSYFSWHQNQKLLSQIPASSNEEKELLHFLEKRWLAKSTGFFSSFVDWICPCFGISVQVHPETTSSYARDPWNKLSQTYEKCKKAWIESLPHPKHFPLILTRPSNLQDYLPNCLVVEPAESVQTTAERLALKMQEKPLFIILDLTALFSTSSQVWKSYESSLCAACQERQLNLSQILCIEELKQKEIGGIRQLPFSTLAHDQIAKQHQYLLERIAVFGLTASRIELDRASFESPPEKSEVVTPLVYTPSREQFISNLNAFEQSWKKSHPQKNLMVKGTVQLLKGLICAISEKRWSEIIHCQTRSPVVYFSFMKIESQLRHLLEDKEETLFFDTASRLEQIHAALSSLLEVLSPFATPHFPPIYKALLGEIPSPLRPLTSCAVHSSGMTSLRGILKAVGSDALVLYGQNTYYECAKSANFVAKALSIEEATEKDWKEASLLLAQFNPVLKRIDYRVNEYRGEKVAETLQKALNAREGKPLTLALDCTLDFINSPRVGRLLSEFQRAIESGALNVICYRSGLKYDLFGMDNYSGAPLYMIHNQDSKWAAFDRLLNDPVLLCDRLSLNWFCLAYQHAAPQLELYRKQIFDNTRALLDKIPPRMLSNQGNDYRIIPFEKGTDPAFIDIKVYGPFHQIRGAALVGGAIYLKCMEGGHPIFYRPSIGFYHPNFTMLFDETCTTLRLTLGLDPTQVDTLARCFEMIDQLNGPSPTTTLEKLIDSLPIPSR